MEKIAIIGAGITGLTTAFYLKKRNIPFHIFDTASHIGGVIQTKKKNGFVFETGPNTGVISKPEVMELFEDLNALDLLETAPDLALNRFIFKTNKLHALPSGPLQGLKTPLFSLKNKIGILFEPFRKKGTNPEENLTSFVKRRLGTSILNYAVDPFVSGVYASTPDEIIPKYALPKLYALEEKYGSFILGSVHKMKEKKSERDKKATKKTFSACGGLSSLVDKLIEKIGRENITLEADNLFVLRNNACFRVHYKNQEEDFYKVIFTGGANTLLNAFPFLEKENVSEAFQVHYNPVIEVAVGFNKYDGFPLNGFGALMPSIEKRDILGVLFMSSLFKNRAPENGAMLAVFMAGSRHKEFLELSDAEIFEKVKKELMLSLKLKEFSPDLFEITRHKNAIPQYDTLSKARFEAYDKIEKQFPGLILGGNGINGIGMGDRIAQGKKLAEKV